jgi:hypothetical protein
MINGTRRFTMIAKLSAPAALLCFFSTLALGAGTQTIRLIDGSRLSGQVISLHDGVYTIESSSLGRVTLPQTQVQSIGLGASSERGDSPYGSTDISAMQKGLLSDPQMMQDISALGQEPAVQAVLSDPQLMQDIQAGNISALYNNPKFLQLMNNTKIQAIQRQVIGQ